MFAEAATMYLSPHVARENDRYVTRDRAHLQQHHPRIFDFIDRVFREELPARVEEGRLASMSESRQWLTRLIDGSWELHPLVSKMPTDVVLTLARRHLERAGFDGNPTDLEEAQRLIDVCLRRIEEGDKVAVGEAPYQRDVSADMVRMLTDDVEALRRRFSSESSDDPEV